MISVLTRERQREIGDRRGEGVTVKIEAEIGGTQPHAKDSPEPPEA